MADPILHSKGQGSGGEGAGGRDGTELVSMGRTGWGSLQVALWGVAGFSVVGTVRYPLPMQV
jgi:hypothetical protein